MDNLNKYNPPDNFIRMALSDKISFEEIYRKYCLTEKEVKVIMKAHLKLSSYINWRKRVKRRQYKHQKKFASVKQIRRYGIRYGLVPSK